MNKFDERNCESEDEEKVIIVEELFFDEEQVEQIQNLNMDNFKRLDKNLTKAMIEQPVFNGDCLCVALAKGIHGENIDLIKNKIFHLISSFSAIDLSIGGKNGNLVNVILNNKCLDASQKNILLTDIYNYSILDQKNQLFSASLTHCLKLTYSSNKNMLKEASEKPVMNKNIGIFAREERQLTQNHSSMAKSLCNQIDELLELTDKIPAMKK